MVINMELRNLNAFLKVAEEQSVTRAARALGYAQSTVTTQIQQLEEELGVPLFERIGRQLRLTDKGQQLLEIAGRIAAGAEEALSICADGDVEISGVLRLGIVESLQNSVFPGLMHQLHQNHPALQVVVKASDCDTLMELLLRNELDLIYVLDRRVRDPMLRTAYEKRENMFFAAAPDNPLADREKVRLEDILGQEILMTEKGLSYGQALMRYLADRGHTLESCLEIGNPDVILQLVMQGDGITFVPEYVVRRAAEQGKVKLLDYPTPEIEMWQQVLVHKRKWITPAMSALIGLIGTDPVCQ